MKFYCKYCKKKKKIRSANQKFLIHHHVTDLVFADGPGPGTAAGSQEGSEEEQGEGEWQQRPQTTAIHVRQGEPGVTADAAQSLVYTLQSALFTGQTCRVSLDLIYTMVN